MTRNGSAVHQWCSGVLAVSWDMETLLADDHSEPTGGGSWLRQIN